MEADRLNLLGKEDAAAGESRRNENIQFNLIDNNALKELNVRLGATATIVPAFTPDRSYFGSEFGRPPLAVLPVRPFAVPVGMEAYLRAIRIACSAPGRSSRWEVYSLRMITGTVSAWGLCRERTAIFPCTGGQENIRAASTATFSCPCPKKRTPLAADPAVRRIVAGFLAGYPAELPNRPDINPRQLNTNAPQKIDGRDAAIIIQHDPSSRDRVMATYQFVGQVVDAFQFVAGQNPNTDTKSHRARLTWTREWSSATLTSLSGGFDRVGSLLVPDSPHRRPSPYRGWRTPPSRLYHHRAFNSFRYEASVISVRGSHTLIAGAGVLRRQDNGAEVDAHRGFFSFTGDFGRNGIDNLRYGTPSQYIGSVGNVHRGFRQWMPEMYAGDNWKLNANLTLNYGLRYEPAGRPVEVNGVNTIPYGCDCNNLAPRFGFAYRLPGLWGVVPGARLRGWRHLNILGDGVARCGFRLPRWLVVKRDLATDQDWNRSKEMAVCQEICYCSIRRSRIGDTILATI